jgi:hypothetical protein
MSTHTKPRTRTRTRWTLRYEDGGTIGRYGSKAAAIRAGLAQHFPCEVWRLPVSGEPVKLAIDWQDAYDAEAGPA